MLYLHFVNELFISSLILHAFWLVRCRDVNVEFFPNPDIGYENQVMNPDIAFLHRPTGAVGLLISDDGSV